MLEKTPRKRSKKAISLVLVVVATGEENPLTARGKAQIIRGTCDLLEEQADEMDPPRTSGD
ncbi:MAG: hypothetical protein WAK16_06500 [Candidatus Cybelea sp.]